MARFQVAAPDGHTYEFEAADDATPQQLDVMTREVAGYAKNYPVTEAKPAAPATPTEAAINQMPIGSAGREAVRLGAEDVGRLAQGGAQVLDLGATVAGKALSAPVTAAGWALDLMGDKRGTALHDVARGLANPPSLSEAIDPYIPTSPGTSGTINRTVGNFVGGAMAFPVSAMEGAVARFVGEAPKSALSTAAKMSAPTGNAVVEAGDKAGVRILTSDVKPPRTFIGKAAQATGEKIPITGTGPVRAAQQSERIAAVKNLAVDYGAATSDDLAAPAIDKVANDLATRRGAELTRLTNAKNSVIDSIPGTVPVDQTMAAIDKEIAKLEALKSKDYAPVIAKLQDWKQAIQGQGLKNIEALRKQFGESFKAPELAGVRGTGEKALSNIYGPLRDDMGAFIKAAGQSGDFAKWSSANEALSGMAGELKNRAMRSVLRSTESTPEDVGKLLFSQNPSDVRRLYAGLSPGGRAKAQAAILQRAIEKSGGMEGLSADRFANQMTSLGKQVGIFFQDDDLARINGLTRVLKATKRAAEASVAPPTGVQNVPYAMGAGLTAIFGLAGGIGTAGGLGLLARAYESVLVRSLLLKIGQSKPGSVQEAKLIERASTAIASAAQSHGRSAALNDNISTITSAAASGGGAETQGE